MMPRPLQMAGHNLRSDYRWAPPGDAETTVGALRLRTRIATESSFPSDSARM